MSNRQNSLAHFIIVFLSSARSTRRFHQILREQVISKYKKRSVSTALTRMRQMGYVEYSPYGWTLTPKGCLRAGRVDLLSYIPSPFIKDTTYPNSLVAFDIPEIDRKTRDWLRNQIKIFGYKMLQQSLWVGPGPLPKVFLDRLSNLEIKKNVKIFSITKGKK